MENTETKKLIQKKYRDNFTARLGGPEKRKEYYRNYYQYMKQKKGPTEKTETKKRGRPLKAVIPFLTENLTEN